MKIALSSDHRGVEAVSRLIEHLTASGHEVVRLGPRGSESSDYPDAAWLVGTAVARGEADYGILVCGSGNGVCMAANKVGGIRAALVCDASGAEMTRRHNDANVLCLSGDRTSPGELAGIVDAFLGAPFEGGRHQRRVNKIAAIERGQNPAEIAANAAT